MTFKKVKGTKDFYPKEKATQNYIFSIFREIASRYNFFEIDTPVFEELNTLTEKEGDEIKEQIFLLEKRSKEQLGLRFDMTVPAVRLYCQQGKTLAKPVQWFYLAKNWRYERPQKGRLREFYQFGVECLGSSDPLADAQVIQLAIDALKALGLDNNDFFVRLNNRKLLQGILANLVDPDRFEETVTIVDKREKVDEDTFFELLRGVGVKDPSKVVELLELTEIEDLEKLHLNKVGQEGLKELRAVYDVVDKNYVRLSLDTVRGLAYYTSTVFEIFDTETKYRSICGGGRYDKLVEQFGGENTPATGFGMGYETLTLLLEDKGLLPEPKMGPKYYVAPVTDSVKKDAAEIAQMLRMKNTVQLGLTARSLGKQFTYADTIGADYVVIVGEKDLKEQQVTLRDMDTGEESKVSLNKLSDL